jgi:cytidylate kinase
VIGEMEERDRRDSTRAHSPLRCADDAERVDTSFESVDQVVAELESRVRRVLRERA